MAAISHDAPSAATPIKPVTAVLLIVAILAFCGVFIALNAAVGSAEFFIGFFFLFYWAGLQKAQFAELPATALGGAFGLALALALQQLTARLGGATGGLAFVALIIPVLYLLVRGHLALVVNNAAMLFLTVGTISHVQAHASFRGLFVSFALAVAFFGGLLWVFEKIRSAASARAPARAAPAE